MFFKIFFVLKKNMCVINFLIEIIILLTIRVNITFLQEGCYPVIFPKLYLKRVLIHSFIIFIKTLSLQQPYLVV